jgi:Na+/H+ antiporter NhaD/arsenite permease-like protein
VLVVFFAAVFITFRRRMLPLPEYQRRVAALDESEALGDRRLLYLSLAILGLVVVGFLLHGALDLEPATVALGGATALMIAGGIHPREALLEVEWATIFFFVGLFMVVGGVEEAGLLEDIGQSMSDASGGHLWAGTMLVLWSGALLSGIVDNIPFTAAMIPVVKELGQDLGAGQSAGNPLWWALALGAGLGGNLTLVAASANVYVAGVADRAGYKISFLEFLKWGGLITLGSLALATVYLWLRYLL